MASQPDNYLENRKLLGTVMAEERTNHRISQAEMARRLKRPQSYVAKIESGERRVSYIEVWEFFNACDTFPGIVNQAFEKAQKTEATTLANGVISRTGLYLPENKAKHYAKGPDPMPKLPSRKVLDDLLPRLLRHTRTFARLSQVELAAKLKRPQSYVSKIESGERKAEWLEVREIVKACNSSMLSLDGSLSTALSNLKRKPGKRGLLDVLPPLPVRKKPRVS